MAEYIKRSDALNFEMEIEADPDEIQAITKGMALYGEHIKRVPAANVIKPRKGKWTRKEVQTREFGRLLVVECSKCKKNQTYRTKYCPNCGAEMEMPNVQETCR